MDRSRVTDKITPKTFWEEYAAEYVLEILNTQKTEYSIGLHLNCTMLLVSCHFKANHRHLEYNPYVKKYWIMPSPLHDPV